MNYYLVLYDCDWDKEIASSLATTSNTSLANLVMEDGLHGLHLEEDCSILGYYYAQNAEKLKYITLNLVLGLQKNNE